MGAEVSIRVKLTFPEDLVPKPVVAHLVRDFDVVPNIRRADITEHSGWIICELEGAAEQLEAAVAWLRADGIGVDLLGDVLES
jgi:L-aspartate semialdehyde sulfurtransferase ferredoxin